MWRGAPPGVAVQTNQTNDQKENIMGTTQLSTQAEIESDKAQSTASSTSKPASKNKVRVIVQGPTRDILQGKVLDIAQGQARNQVEVQVQVDARALARAGGDHAVDGAYRRHYGGGAG